MVNSILASGITGIQRGVSGIQQNAQEIASAATAEDGQAVESLAGPLVDLRVNLHQVQASALVIETVDQVLNTLIGHSKR